MALQITYHMIAGRQVTDSEGRQVGRVSDLRAENVGGELHVTGLYVGEVYLLARFGLRVIELIGRGTLPGYYVPWSAVERIGKTVELRVAKVHLERRANVGRVGRSQ